MSSRMNISGVVDSLLQPSGEQAGQEEEEEEGQGGEEGGEEGGGGEGGAPLQVMRHGD